MLLFFLAGAALGHPHAHTWFSQEQQAGFPPWTNPTRGAEVPLSSESEGILPIAGTQEHLLAAAAVP